MPLNLESEVKFFDVRDLFTFLNAQNNFGSMEANLKKEKVEH